MAGPVVARSNRSNLRDGGTITPPLRFDGPREGSRGRRSRWRERAEIASVERVGGPRVHQENFVLADDAAALPDRKRAAPAVALSGVAHSDRVDSDAAADATDRLSGDCRHVFQQRHAARQIAAIGKETGKGFGRPDDDQVAGVSIDDRVDGVETDRHAGAGVPDEPRRASSS